MDKDKFEGWLKLVAIGIWGICVICGTILTLGIVAKVAGFWGLVLATFILPITVLAGGLYAGFAVGNWLPLFLTYGGAIPAGILFGIAEVVSRPEILKQRRTWSVAAMVAVVGVACWVVWHTPKISSQETSPSDLHVETASVKPDPREAEDSGETQKRCTGVAEAAAAIAQRRDSGMSIEEMRRAAEAQISDPMARKYKLELINDIYNGMWPASTILTSWRQLS